MAHVRKPWPRLYNEKGPNSAPGYNPPVPARSGRSDSDTINSGPTA